MGKAQNQLSYASAGAIAIFQLLGGGNRAFADADIAAQKRTTDQIPCVLQALNAGHGASQLTRAGGAELLRG